jgi:hypothetical protein
LLTIASLFFLEEGYRRSEIKPIGPVQSCFAILRECLAAAKGTQQSHRIRNQRISSGLKVAYPK